MASSKAKKLLRKSTLLQGEMLDDLHTLAKSIERAETLLAELKRDTEAMTARHPASRRTTREDIAYLEDLLQCAKKKLAWEKQMETLAKRTPEVLAKVSTAMNDTPTHPPTRSEAASSNSCKPSKPPCPASMPPSRQIELFSELQRGHRTGRCRQLHTSKRVWPLARRWKTRA